MRPSFSAAVYLGLATEALGQFAVDSQVGCSIGPVMTADQYHPEFAAWAVELAQQLAQASLKLADENLRRNEQLLREGAVAQVQVDQARLQHEARYRDGSQREVRQRKGLVVACADACGLYILRLNCSDVFRRPRAAPFPR